MDGVVEPSVFLLDDFLAARVGWACSSMLWRGREVRGSYGKVGGFDLVEV